MPPNLQADWLYQDGSPIAPEDQARALAERKATWELGKDVAMRGPDGERYAIPSHKAWDAIDQGFRPESSEENLYEEQKKVAAEHPGQAFAESYFNTLTFGLGEALEGSHHPSVEQQKRLIQEENPWASAGGTALGLVTPAGLEAAGGKAVGGAVSLGTRPAARALAKIVGEALPEATSVLGRAGRAGAQLGAEAAVETAAFTGGQEIQRARLANESITVERMLNAIGEGATEGLGGGFLLGAGGKLGGAGIARALRGISNFSEEAAPALALKATGATPGDFARLGREGSKRIGQELLEGEGLLAREGVAGRSVKLTEARRAAGTEIETLLTDLDKSGAKIDKGAFLGKVDEYISELRSGTGPEVRQAKKLEKDFINNGKLEAALDSWRDIQQFRVNKVDALARGKMFNQTRQQSLYAFGRKLEDLLEEQLATQAGEETLGAYKGLKARSGNLRAAGEIAEREAAKEPGRGLGMTELLSGATTALGIIHAGPLGAIPGIALEAGLKAAKSEAGAAMLARAFESIRGGTDTAALKISSLVNGATKEGVLSVRRELPVQVSKVVEAFRDRSAAIREAQASPESLTGRIQKVVEPLIPLSPNIARRTTQTLVDDAAWLAQRLPKARSSKAGLDSVSPSEAADYLRAEMALTSPVRTLKELAVGRLIPEVVTVLRERRPELQRQVTAEIEQRVAELAARGEEPSYASRVQFSLLTGAPQDVTMRPDIIMAAQSVWDEQREEQAQKPPPITPSRVGPRRHAGRRRTGVESIEESEELA